jgi:hypothetical protein
VRSGIGRILPLVGALVAAFAIAAMLGPRHPTPRAAAPLQLGGATPPRWIVAGGGSDPGSNEVQIERDVELAAEVFAPLGPGDVLYAGGAGSRAVRELGDEGPAGDPLVRDLGTLFDPRGGRASRYRDTRLTPSGAATRSAFLDRFQTALLGTAPLTVFLAGHGAPADDPRDVPFLLWGGEELLVGDLTELLDDAPHRPVRLVVTSCYGGAFAELAFAAADPEAGMAPGAERCGLFATAWDRVASGCDPDPDRAAHEGYGLHFLSALRGEDRDGAPIDLDLDGDGRIGLSEAHARARIAADSLDVPTSTSDRFLRAAVPEEVTVHRLRLAPLDTEAAVVAGLGRRLGVADGEEAEARWRALDALREDRADELEGLDRELLRRETALRGALLHRFPVVDDPWDPRFAPTIEAHRETLRGLLDEGAEARTALAARREDVAATHDDLLRQQAQLERLLLAEETMRLAAWLRGQGGELWERYRALRACERGAP